MSPSSDRRRDRGIALGLGVVYVALLLASAGNLGYARDEGFYFQAADAYGEWLELLFRDPLRALTRAEIDRFWVVNHEHPSLFKLSFYVSRALLYDTLGLFSEPGTAYRFPGMLAAGLGVAVVFLWASRAVGRAPACFAAVAFAAMPRVFYHAHLACFDVPVAALTVTTAYAYARSLESERHGWALATGVLYGLLLETKHNAWLLPFVFVGHTLLLYALRRRSGPVSLRVPRALFFIAGLGPPIFLLGWPWLWFDTWPRLLEYVRFHTGHVYYNMEFLGRTYWKPPMPLGYAWLMTLATVPLATLVPALVGFANALCTAWRTVPRAAEQRLSTDLLWILALLVGYAPWWLPGTPIFGGTKHWMTAYPFLCLLGARGFALAERALGELCRERGVRIPVGAALGAALLVGPLVMTAHSHPWGLSFYTPLVGGAPGAASLGLNRTFWGYTTGAVLPFVNERAPPRSRLYLHDTATASFRMLLADGRVRPDLRGTLALEQSSLALYHHEPHMRRVEYQIWVDYGTTTPAHVASYDGVPVVWVYERPRTR